jgi:hypothetical protein
VFPNAKGQVSRKEDIAKWIQLLSSLESTRTIIEVGTWNGKGTTAAIVRGVSSRAGQLDCQVWSLEVNPAMARIATRVLKRHKFIKVVYGSLVDSSSLDSKDLTIQESEWFEQDRSFIDSAPLINPMPGKQIDLAIFDGGEFSTYAEFKVLEQRLAGWIVLDDTKSRKSQKLLENFRLSPEFQVVWESGERNGVAVVKRHLN